MPRMLVHTRLLADLSDFYASRCNIQAPTETRDTFGDVLLTWANVAALMGISCTLAPMGGPGRQEVRRPDGTIEIATHQASLAGSYAAITPKMRAVIDGATYAILGVDGDSRGRTTRLNLEVVQ